MALEWVVLGYTAGAEAIMLLLLTLPGFGPIKRGLTTVIRNALKPMMSVVPFCLFLLMDIYWKYETKLSSCHDPENCSPSEHLRHEKSLVKTQRNLLLIVATLLLYWLLVSFIAMAARLDALNEQIKKIRKAN